MAKNNLEQLKYLVAQGLDLDIEFDEIDPDMPLLSGGLSLDSLAIVELITLSEEAFGIHFGEEDLNMQAFASLRALAGVIDARQAESRMHSACDTTRVEAPMESLAG